MEFTQQENEITIRQSGYIKDILDRFGMSDSRAVSIPLNPGTKLNNNNEESNYEENNIPHRELIGALMYLAVYTRPDIAYAISYLSQFNNSHWIAAKRVLRYLQGTRNVGLSFRKTGKSLIGFVDADWANCPNDRRSYTGFAFMLGGCPISWKARKERTVALSSTKAEYMALTKAVKEAINMKRFLHGFDKISKVKIFCDNHSVLKLAKNPVFHNRSKHIDVRHHYVREIIKDECLKIAYIRTDKMAADILTKSLSKQKYENCMKLLGLNV